MGFGFQGIFSKNTGACRPIFLLEIRFRPLKNAIQLHRDALALAAPPVLRRPGPPCRKAQVMQADGGQATFR
jgi:hypothetical protein